MTGAIVGIVFVIVLTMQAFSSYEAPTAADVPAQVVTLPRAPAPEGGRATGAGPPGTDPEPDRPGARPAAPASVGIPPRRYAKPAAGSLAGEPAPLGRRVGPGAAAPKTEPAGAKPRIPPRINDAKLVQKVQKTIARSANPAYGATWKGRGGARDCGEYCIIIPTWTGHFPDVTRFMQSVMVHADPADNFGIRLVVGDNKEKAELEKRLAKLKTCGVNWEIDALEAILKAFKISKSATNLFKARGRYHYQSLKKMYAARYYDYKLSMWFDSEGELLKPTSFKKVFEDYMEAPYFWRAELVKGKQRERWANVKRCLDIAGVGLGDVDMSAASLYDFFEHYTWVLEKPIVERIFAASEARHEADLVSVWVGHEQRCFEWGMYAMFVYAHRADYPQYRFETIRDVMSRYLPKPFVDAQFRAGRLRMEGVFEKLLSPETYNGFFKLFADYKVWWVRQSEPPLKANSRCQAKNGQKTKGGWCRKCGTKAGLPCYSTFSAKLVAKMVDEHPYLSVTVCNPDMTYHFRKAGKKPAVSKTCDKCGKGACQLRRENWQSVVPALYGK